MPFYELAVAHTDVDGAALGLALDAPAPEPLAGLVLTHPAGGTLTLGVLGASHVITAEHAGRRFSEEVSCSAQARGGALPARHDAPGYALTSMLKRCGATEFDALVASLRDRCGRDPHCLGGRFPGDDAALTVLAAEPDGAGWQWHTWHLYPSAVGGTAVTTISRWRP
ncbi:DUF2617 family protein [Mycobacterium sp. PS03-16]|uniref:DUF2617 family protein n=1 Tax=Mycobacterium sp. PS03-16 TaxID=2559611 RepID=UPI001073E1E8|nr:DUF2617 family protein [Mycobacterium sp. PS03-16]TFV60367.1 DUF2617 family protein [Mycobacterium sp. PS03-16]